MEKENKAIEIRDNRGYKRFFIDDVFHDTYARLVLPSGYAVYAALCRRANKKQSAWPSLDVMCEEVGISKPTAIDRLKLLEYLRIIKKERIGKRVNNRYTLLAVSSWRRDWEVMLNDLNSCDVKQFKFTGKTILLHWLNHFTSNSKVTQSKVTQVRNAAASAAAPSEEKPECKEAGCKEKPMRDKEYCSLHQSMTVEQFVEWCNKSEARHIHIIGEWADTLKPSLETVAQWEEFISRHSRTAKRLVPFSRDQLERGWERIERNRAEGWLTEFTLETLLKYVTNSNN